MRDLEKSQRKKRVRGFKEMTAQVEMRLDY